MTRSEHFAVVALRRLFDASTPRGRGPIEARTLYKLWAATGLRREDLAGSIRTLTERGVLRAEYHSGNFYYTISREAAEPAANDGESNALASQAAQILKDAASRPLSDPEVGYGRRNADDSRAATGAQKRRAQNNRLLLCLAGIERAKLEQDLEIVHVRGGQVLWEAGEALRYVYFPLDCIISLVAEMSDGASCEVGMVGNEGVVDVVAVIGQQLASRRAEVAKAGYALRMAAEVLRKSFDGTPAVRELVLTYLRALQTQITQLVACNRHHGIEQQVCRLLLSSIDRMRSDRLSLTHEHIARMLGVRREGVTEALGRLKRKGYISAGRGIVAVLDRAALLQHSCECYSIIKQAYDQLRPAEHSA